VAHSMGNRCVGEALQDKLELGGCQIDQCVLAAPDVDADVFKRDIAPKIIPAVGQLTLYASAKDKALLGSQLVHRYPRAGDAGPGIIAMESLESVDASQLETDYLGHSYFGDSPYIIEDLIQIVAEHLPAEKRKGMRRVQVAPQLQYWTFTPNP